MWVLGGVFSQTEGFTGLGGLWGPMAFHAVCMGLGTYLVGKAGQPVPAVQGE